jgi:hypothetical protein
MLDEEKGELASSFDYCSARMSERSTNRASSVGSPVGRAALRCFNPRTHLFAARLDPCAAGHINYVQLA